MKSALYSGLEKLELTLSEQQQKQLLDYLALLQKWNKVYNLTAIHDPAEMLTRHLLDSLAVINPLRRDLASKANPSVLDVGTGAGLPGVVIAVCCPSVSVCCVDAVGKKVAFVRQAGLSLGLKNLSTKHARVQSLVEKYDVVTSRAFASLADFVGCSKQAVAEGGVWMAMKSKAAQAEITDLPSEVVAFHVEQLTVPQLDEERSLVWMRLH